MASDLLFPPCGDLKREVPAMRKMNTTSLLPALLCGAALLAFGCDRGEERHAGQVEKRAPTQTAQIARTSAPAPAPVPPPQINELQTPPQTVQVRPQTPPASTEKSDARERRLQQTKTQRPATAHTAPRLSPPSAETAPAPAPAPAPAIPEPAP